MTTINVATFHVHACNKQYIACVYLVVSNEKTAKVIPVKPQGIHKQYYTETDYLKLLIKVGKGERDTCSCLATYLDLNCHCTSKGQVQRTAA